MARYLWLLWLLALCAPAAAQVPAQLVDPTLMQRAQTQGTVRVIVEVGGVNVVPEPSLSDEMTIHAQRYRIAVAQDGVRQALRGLRHRVVREFRTIPLLAIEASPDSLRMLEAMRGVVVRVHDDALLAPSLIDSGPLIGALASWNVGLDGTGTVIAIVDTGVDKNHPFLAGKVIEEACFSSTTTDFSTTCPNGFDEQTGQGSGVPCPVPDCAHGTHVAGIAAGGLGIARGASIIAVQVFSRGSTSAACAGGPPPCIAAFTADVLAGLDYTYGRRAAHNVAAVNLSLGGGRFFAPCDGNPTKAMIDNLRAAGIATVVASGNDGFTDSLGAPACVSTAVSVAATTKRDGVWIWSNVASFLSLFTPGASIVSSVPGEGFVAADGTSMAAPHVAGAFAILRQAFPGATVSQMLEALQATGRPITDVTGITRPRVQVDAALASLGLGPLPPFALIESTATSFSGGHTITVYLTAAAPAGNPPLDLYVGSLWPDDNTIAFLIAPNTFGGLGQFSAPVSVGPMATVASGFAVLRLPVLTYTFPSGGIPVGTYYVFASMFRQGSLADNTLNDGDRVWLSFFPVTYSP